MGVHPAAAGATSVRGGVFQEFSRVSFFLRSGWCRERPQLMMYAVISAKRNLAGCVCVCMLVHRQKEGVAKRTDFS